MNSVLRHLLHCTPDSGYNGRGQPARGPAFQAIATEEYNDGGYVAHHHDDGRV